MYGVVMRRTMNASRAGETRERAKVDFWPKLEKAPGFVSFTLIQGEDGVNSAVILFDSKEQAEAFRSQQDGWNKTLSEHGHHLESRTAGEVIEHLTAKS